MPGVYSLFHLILAINLAKSLETRSLYKKQNKTKPKTRKKMQFYILETNKQKKKF